ncbi:hypothetical protein JWG40_05685 [Leptospira sp. 201903074]|uniref:hypothetical protein n=1 Tax=Leptospira abararensis TaxID=2810036 RepID=UPI0019633176|nr:hypothetical protein [Leptospira abararensis]MBM9546498.1 hypothetical protein [Leptospira abararensis]
MRLFTIGFAIFIFRWLPKELFASSFEAKVYNSGFYLLSLNPISANTPWDQWLTPFFLWATGLVSRPEDIVSLLDFVTIVSGVSMVCFVTYRFHWFFGFGLAVLLASSPLFLIFKTWIGFSDPITFLLISFYIIISLGPMTFRWKWILLTLVLFLGFSNHCFQFIVLISIVGLVLFLEDKTRWKLLLFPAFTSAILYGLFSILLLSTTDVVWNQTRVSVFSNMIGGEFIRMNVSEPILGTVGLFHGLWPFVIYLMYRKPISIFVIFVCYIISMLTYDTNRVFAILSTPVLILYSIEFWKGSKFWDRYLWISLAILSPVISTLYPLFYKWDGRIIYLQ